MSCILCHRGVQLILAYSWARPVVLVAGKGREVMFLFLLFLHFHSCSSFFPVPLFHLFCYLFSFLPFSGRLHKMTHKGWRVVKPQHNQSINMTPLCWLGRKTSTQTNKWDSVVKVKMSIQCTLKAPSKICSTDSILIFYCSSEKKKSWYFMWIVWLSRRLIRNVNTYFLCEQKFFQRKNNSLYSLLFSQFQECFCHEAEMFLELSEQ